MLKFLDKDNNVKFVLQDDDTQPREVNEVAREVLKDMGLQPEKPEEKPEEPPKEKPKKKDKKTPGISQDDREHIGI